jgi:hypothetical protein
MHDGFRTVTATAGDLRAERVVPVVQREMHFLWWGIGPDLKYITATTPAPTTPEGMQYCRDNGILVLGWKGAVGKTTEELAAAWADPGGSDGIAIDELGGYEHDPGGQAGMDMACEALARAKAANPKSFLAVWNAGSLTAQRANAYRDHADLVMLECYLNFARNAFGATDFQDFLDQRLRMASRMDLLRKCVIGLGITDHLGGITPGELRTEIEHIRLTAPDSPGLAWFTYGANETVRKLADAAAAQYFIRPCLLAREWDLQYAAGRLALDVYNIGAMDARDLAVAFYLGHPEQGGRLIGLQHVPVLHAPRGWSKDLDEAKPEEARSRAYGLREVAVDWAPQPGHYDIWARVHAGPGCTVLADLVHKRVNVPREGEL